MTDKTQRPDAMSGADRGNDDRYAVASGSARRANGRSGNDVSAAEVPEAFGHSDTQNDSKDTPPERDENASNDSRDAHPSQRQDKPEKAAEKPGPKKKPIYKRPIPITIAAVVLVGGLTAALLWWLHARKYESTDDAFIAADITHVAPQVGGRVERVLVDDNQEVKAGDVLVEIRPLDFQVRLEQAKAAQAEVEGKMEQSKAQEAVAAANVEGARADVTSAETNAATAAADLQRYQSLSAQAVSRQQLDQVTNTAKGTAAQLQAVQKRLSAAQAQVKAAAAETAAAADSVRSAQSQVHQAEIQLSYTSLRAHRDGWVTRKSVAPGDYVQIGQELLSVVPYDVWVTANFKETQLGLMRTGQPVTLDIDAYPDHEFHGTIQSFQAGSGSAFSLLPPENATGNYVKVVQRVPVKITFDSRANQPNSGQRIAPGMSVVPTVKVR